MICSEAHRITNHALLAGRKAHVNRNPRPLVNDLIMLLRLVAVAVRLLAGCERRRDATIRASAKNMRFMATSTTRADLVQRSRTQTRCQSPRGDLDNSRDSRKYSQPGVT